MGVLMNPRTAIAAPNRRSFLTFLGLAPGPLTMTFCAAPPAIAEKIGCTGFLITDSALTAAQVEIIKETWLRGFNGELRDGEKVSFLVVS